MTERTIFLTAIDKHDPADRATYLDGACAGDVVMRQRIEALLRSSDKADTFLSTPAMAGPSLDDATRTHHLEPTPDPAGLASGAVDRTQAEPVAWDESLAFLAPARIAGALGRLDHHDVLEVVGQGGMGIVLKARDTTLERIVAIKVLAPQLAVSGNARKRFAREAKAAAAVRDEHVVDIHAVNDSGPIPYLVMEYIGGITLDDRIKQGGPLEVKEILRIGFQTACGLAAAHKQGLIHRDIKPGNILLENGVQRVKITDFGLARAADDASLTQSGVIAGTPMYMSPEQARGEPVDHRSDLFSLGSVLYTLCTGRPAFRAASTMAVLKRVCEETPRPISEINPDIPDWLATMVVKLLAKAPAERFQTAAELADLLSQCLAHVQQPQQNPLPPMVLALPRTPRRRRRTRALAAAAVVLLAVIGSGLAYWAIQPHDGKTPIEPNDPRPLTLDERLKLPSPFDGRKREDIPRALLTLAGGGDPDQAPAELVAMLGDSRFLLPNAGLRSFMAQSSDGKVLAVPCGNDVALYDAHTGASLRTLKGHVGWVYAVAFSPDGTRLISGCFQADNTARVWNVATGELVATCTAHNASVLSVAFSPDGKRVASGSQDGDLRIWEADTGKELVSLPRQGATIVSVAFSPDGNRIITGSRDMQALVWDAGTGKALESLKGHTQEMRRVAFSAKDHLLATGSDAELILWNADTCQKIKTLQTPAAWLAFDPDSRTIMAAKHDHNKGTVHTVTRWNLATYERVASLPLLGVGDWALYHLSPDGKTLFGTRAMPDVPYVRTYDAVTGKEQFPAQGHQGAVYSVAVSADGKLLASGGTDHAVKVWDLAAWKAGEALPPVRTLQGHAEQVSGVAFSPDGKLLASASGDPVRGGASVIVWDVRSGASIGAVRETSNHILRLAFSPDGNTLAFGGQDGSVRRWDVATRQQISPLFTHTARVRCVAYSPDGNLFASGGDDKTVQLSIVASGQLLHTAALPDIVNNVAFSADGRTLAAVRDVSGANAGPADVHLWDVDTWKEQRLPGHTRHVHGAEFCPANPLLATGAWDGTLRFWDRTTSIPRSLTIGPGPFDLDAQNPFVVHLTFTPEGRYVVTGNGNGTISVLKVPAAPPPYDPGPAKELPDPVELAKRPSAADALRRADIPAELLQKAAAAAGGVAPPELVAVLPHGEKGVGAVAISADSKYLASGNGDETTKIWDLATGKLLQTFTHTTSVYDVAFVPRRGKGGGPSLLLATAGWRSGMAMLWNADTGELLHTLTHHTGDVMHVAASPDGRWLASCDWNGTIHVWDPASGKLLRTLQNPPMEWGDLAASPDGRLLAATTATDGVMRLWDPLSGWLQGTLAGHQGGVRDIAFLPDGRMLASSGQNDRTIRLWDLATLREKQALSGTQSIAVKVVCRADGRMLVTDDHADGKVRLWDLSAEPPRSRAIALYPKGIHGIAMTPEGRYIATANPDGTVYILKLAEPGVDFRVPPDPVTLKPTATLPAHDGRVTAVAFGPGSGIFASGGKDGTLKLWDLGKSEIRLTLAAHGEGVRNIVFAPGGKTLASAGIDGSLALWDAADGKKLHALAGNPGGAAPLLFAGPAGPLLSGGADGTIRFWDVATGQPQRTLSACKGWLTHLSLHPDGRTLATAGIDGTVRLWDLESAKEKQSIADRTCVCFAPDGTRLAVVTRAGHIEVLDGRTLELRAVLAGHSEPPDCVCFSPDGKLLASSGLDRSIRVWDAARGHLLAQLTGHAGQVWGLAWSADSKTLAAGDEDGRLLLWTLSALPNRA